VIHALAILPEHVHLVLAHMERDIRVAVGHLKSNATRVLHEKGWFVGRTPWSAKGWNVYLDTDEDVFRAVRYVEGNPGKEGLPGQRWSFVEAYDPAMSRAARLRRGM